MRKQRNFLTIISTSIVGILMLIVTYQAQAGIIIAETYFTLRSTSNAGPADAMNEFGGVNEGGFLGLMTNWEVGNQIDHTQWEFDMSTITGPVSSATLDWTLLSSAPTNTILIDAYSADGMASLDDWLIGAGTAGSFSVPETSFDITSLINDNLTESYLGFSFSIFNSDTTPKQASIWAFSDKMSLNFTTNVPEPDTLVLMALGLIGLGFKRR